MIPFRLMMFTKGDFCQYYFDNNRTKSSFVQTANAVLLLFDNSLALDIRKIKPHSIIDGN